MIHFYSTQDKSIRVSLEEAVMRGLSEDGGLFMPDRIPTMPDSFFTRISTMSLTEISSEVSKTLLQGAIPSNDLKIIIERAINFDAPITALSSEVTIQGNLRTWVKGVLRNLPNFYRLVQKRLANISRKTTQF